MKALKKITLPAWIFISLVLGILVGLCFLGNPDFTTDYIKPFGTIYINLLKLMVVPIVVTSIISGVVSMGDIKRVGAVGWKTVIYYLGTTLVAIVIGLVFASAANGIGLFPVLEVSGLEYTASSSSIMDVIVSIFPSNMWSSFSSATMLQVIVIALFFGFGILMAGEKGQPLANWIESVYAVVMEIMMMIIRITPIGVFCLMCNVVAVNGPSVVGSLFLVILVTYVAYIVHFLVCYGASVKYLSGMKFTDFIKGIWPAMVVSFTTTSSVATLPLNIECSNEMGADPEISGFVLPLGATINMDGTSIYLGVATVFIATCYGITLSVSQMVMIVLTATLASIGTAGVSGAGMIMLAMVLETAGLPVEGIALIAGVDKLFDMGRTTLNIVGDSSCALAMTKMDRKRTAKLTGKK